MIFGKLVMIKVVFSRSMVSSDINDTGFGIAKIKVRWVSPNDRHFIMCGKNAARQELIFMSASRVR